MNQPETSRTHVAVIHGLAGHWAFMWPLVWWIKRAGFSVSTFGYRSWFWSVERHAKRFANYLEELQQDPEVDSIFIVAHSMGSIVTRTALATNEFSKLQRVVLLAPPNEGSPRARTLGALLPFAKTLNQLSDQNDSYVFQLPKTIDVETGILAASYDFVIPESSTHLMDESDHLTIFSGHNGLLFRPKAAKCIVGFLNHGTFENEVCDRIGKEKSDDC